jgi:hypothetical protein
MKKNKATQRHAAVCTSGISSTSQEKKPKRKKIRAKEGNPTKLVVRGCALQNRP